MEELLNYKENRLWYKLCKSIPLLITPSNKDEVYNLFITNLVQYHPTSLSECVYKMSFLFDYKKSINLINESIQSIKTSGLYGGSFTDEVFYLKIQKCILMIDNGDTDEVEKYIFEYQEIEMNEKSLVLYNFLCYKYYEKTFNYDLCVKYLLDYIKSIKDVRKDATSFLYSLLVKYTLMSEKFYNFSEIYSQESFSYVESPLKEIFLAVQEGNPQECEKYNDDIKRIFGDKERTVLEKSYYVGLLNLCFHLKNKMVPFEIIRRRLNIQGDINFFLLKALGIGLFKGYIDGCKEVLYYNTILPRFLPMNEIDTIRSLYGEWRDRVCSVIEKTSK